MKYFLSLLIFCLASTAAMAKDKVITVKTAKQFIEAIGPERTIVIDSKEPLNITAALIELIDQNRIEQGAVYYGVDYSEEYDEEESKPLPNALEWVTWAPNTDGPTMQIRYVTNLTIKAKKGKATLLATPRYANVLEFIDSYAIHLDHLILGHTEEGYCDKGVVEFDGTAQVTIDDCDFFGCGTEGFVFYESNDVRVNRSTVYDCSYHTMHVRQSRYVRFNDCRFYNNREYEQLNVDDASSVVFTHCSFENLQGKLFSLGNYVQFYGCTFHDCQMQPLTSNFDVQDMAIMRFCTSSFGGSANVQPMQKPKFKLGRYTDGKYTYKATLRDDYSIELVEILDGDAGDCEPMGFAIECINAPENEYETCDTFGAVNEVGRVGASFIEKDGQSFIVIYDDGHEPTRNFVYLGK